MCVYECAWRQSERERERERERENMEREREKERVAAGGPPGQIMR